MRLHITKIMDGATTVLRVDGELLGEGVRELERVARAARPLCIDLTHLMRADARGLAVLRQLREAGAELAGLPPYIALLLDEQGKAMAQLTPK